MIASTGDSSYTAGTVKQLDKKMTAFICRAERYAGTDKDSEVVLQKAGSDTESHLGLPLLLHELLSGIAQIVSVPQLSVIPKLFPGMVWMAVWAGSNPSAVGAEGSLGTDRTAFVMAVQNFTLQNKPLWNLTE